ncbi:MAG: hypothetical protein ABIN18_05610 [Pseudomonadota bacterium]
MIFTTTDRQGFDKALSGVPGSAIQSVYAKPAGDPSMLIENASWQYPLGNPWGWDVYPWNWGKEGEADKENPTPDGQTPGTEGTPWKGESAGGNILMFAAVIGAVLLLTSKSKFLR